MSSSCLSLEKSNSLFKNPKLATDLVLEMVCLTLSDSKEFVFVKTFPWNFLPKIYLSNKYFILCAVPRCYDLTANADFKIYFDTSPNKLKLIGGN